MFHDFGASSLKRTIANCTGFQTFWSADARSGASAAIKITACKNVWTDIIFRECACVGLPLVFFLTSLLRYFITSSFQLSIPHFAERLIQQAHAFIHVS